jgi:hypothetical protein
LEKGSLRSIVVGFAVFVFTFDLLIGTILGSVSRDRHDEYVESIDYQKDKADRELAIRVYRGALDLPLEVKKPETATDTEKK